MDISMGGLTAKAEKHAEILTAVIAAYSRAVDPADKLGAGWATGGLDYLIRYYTFQDPAGWSPLKELQLTLNGGIDGITWKLYRAPHTPQMLTKIGALLYGAGYIGIVGQKWKNIGKKIAIGGAAVGLTMKGSSPGSYGPISSMGDRANGIKGW
jgi:hypothetical protein